MNVMAVFGSARNGNTEFMAESAARLFEEKGATVTRWHLWRMNYKGCTGCGACKTSKDECVLKDDLTPYLDALKKSDVLILSTPLYFFDASSKVRAMLERWYSYFLPMYYTGENRNTRLPSGKHVIFAVSQGAPENHFNDFIQRMAETFNIFNFRPVHVLRNPFGINKDAAVNNETLQAQIVTAVNRVLAGQDPETIVKQYDGGGF